MKSEKFQELRYQLQKMAECEAIKLWRLARKAEKHNLSIKLISEIREEANHCYVNLRTYPDRMLSWDFENKMKYAFRF